MILGLVLASVMSLQSSPPRDLEATAAELRKTGAQVRVGRKDSGPGWEIWLDQSKLATDDAFKKLNGISGLGAIRFLGGGFGDRGVAHLTNLPDLHLLVLFSDRLTDECLKPIAKLKGLTKIDLSYAKLTRAGLGKLSELPKLERLYLYNARFTDADATALESLKRLKLLDLPKTLSEETVARLQKALPTTTVQYRK